MGDLDYWKLLLEYRKKLEKKNLMEIIQMERLQENKLSEVQTNDLKNI